MAISNANGWVLLITSHQEKKNHQIKPQKARKTSKQRTRLLFLIGFLISHENIHYRIWVTEVMREGSHGAKALVCVGKQVVM